MRRKASQAEGSRYAKAWKQEAHSYSTEVRTCEGEVVRERLERSQEPDPGVGGGGWEPGQEACFLLPVPGSQRVKETDWIMSGNSEGSDGSQLGDEGLGRDSGGGGNNWRSGLIREGFGGRGQSQWVWTEGRR